VRYFFDRDSDGTFMFQKSFLPFLCERNNKSTQKREVLLILPTEEKQQMLRKQSSFGVQHSPDELLIKKKN